MKEDSLEDLDFSKKKEIFEAIVQKIVNNPRIKGAILFSTQGKARQSNTMDTDMLIACDAMEPHEIAWLHEVVSRQVLPFKLEVVDFAEIVDSVMRKALEDSGIVIIE